MSAGYSNLWSRTLCHTDVIKARRDGENKKTKFLSAVRIHEPKLCVLIKMEPPCGAAAACVICYQLFSQSSMRILEFIGLDLSYLQSSQPRITPFSVRLESFTQQELDDE
jgi:hypothetical protein